MAVGCCPMHGLAAMNSICRNQRCPEVQEPPQSADAAGGRGPMQRLHAFPVPGGRIRPCMEEQLHDPAVSRPNV